MYQAMGQAGLRFGCLGTHVPRLCGIATFSHDLCEAICQELKQKQACHFVAVNDSPEGYAYPPRVRFEVRQEQTADYKLAADFINIRNLDLLLVQQFPAILKCAQNPTKTPAITASGSQS